MRGSGSPGLGGGLVSVPHFTLGYPAWWVASDQPWTKLHLPPFKFLDFLGRHEACRLLKNAVVAGLNK